MRFLQIASITAAMLVAPTTWPACRAETGPGREIDTTPVRPETVGFSSERLERLGRLIEGEVDRKELAGAVTILARHGRVVDYRTFGYRDLGSGAPMTKDTIFRDYSMTKPVTGVAMMILYEQGKWLPWEPIAKYVPQFSGLKVFKGADAEGRMILAPPAHAPTIGELMSHSAGFSYGSAHSPVDAMYQEKKPMESANLEEMIDKLSAIPLNYEPGTRWLYSVSMDIEGYMIEKLSGESLPAFMREHIFEPLGMTDAGFFVPEEKRSRFATNYRSDAEGHLVPVESAAHGDFAAEPGLPSGGGGMVSTAEDYYRFAQMLASGGRLGGRRILSPATVKLMTSNHLPAKILTGEFGIGQHIMRAGFGYGFNCAVVFDPVEAGLTDGKGTFFWDGAAGTWFWVDPANDVVFIAMIQRMHGHDNHALEYRSHALVYQALVDPLK
ncbi:MAG: beta-lactamase family protein [Acidobacteria bacterium]|nr:beta-lactamase family protein [Acidobacteriota bacterium]